MSTAANGQKIARKSPSGRIVLASRSMLSIATPVAIGIATGEVSASITAAVGALCATLVFFKTRKEPLLPRNFAGVLFGATGYGLGVLCAGNLTLALILPVVLAIVAGAFRATGVLGTITGPHLVMYALMGAGTLHGHAPAWLSFLLFIAGAAWSAVLTLLTARLLPAPDAPQDIPPPIKIELRPPQGFSPEKDPLSFGFLLAGALIVAELLALATHPERPYWVPMAVVIIMRQSMSMTWNRAYGRIAGTVLGVVVGGLIMGQISNPWVLWLFLALCAALLPISATVNYLAKTSVTTTLVMLLFDVVGLRSQDLFVARIVDTLLGCAVVVLVLAVESAIRRSKSTRQPTTSSS